MSSCDGLTITCTTTEGLYPVDLRFSTDYPALPPVARFPAGFFHPNIYDDGKASPFRSELALL